VDERPERTRRAPGVHAVAGDRARAAVGRRSHQVVVAVALDDVRRLVAFVVGYLDRLADGSGAGLVELSDPESSDVAAEVQVALAVIVGEPGWIDGPVVVPVAPRARPDDRSAGVGPRPDRCGCRGRADGVVPLAGLVDGVGDGV